MTSPTATFTYRASIKVSELTWAGKQAFPDVCDVLIRSKKFETFAACASHAKSFMDDVAQVANAGNHRFTLASEISPIVSGVESISADWKDDELARFWLFEPSGEKTVIDAVGQLQILVSLEASS